MALNLNKEELREYLRIYRLAFPDRNRLALRKWKESHREHITNYRLKNLEMFAEKAKRWRAKHPEKAKAHQAVNWNLKRGTLKREPCRVCESQKSEAHHEDYARPLDVIWLCMTHHRQIHQQQQKEIQAIFQT